MQVVAKTRDFGSFHSSNVEELIKQTDTEYKSPKLDVIFNLEEYSKLNLNQLFGSEQIKKDLFYLSDEFTFINHGAFGLSFKPVVEYVNSWKAFAESQPLRFYDRKIMPLLVDLIRLFAVKVFKCKPWELCLVENCTFAFSSLMNSIDLKPNDQIYIFSTTYGVYKKIIKSKCQQTNANLIEEAITFPILDRKDLLDKTLKKLILALELDKEKKIKLIIVDHIPSNQPFVIPYEELAKVVKTKRPDILFVVDAAHSLGSIKNIDLNDVDILFTNCHKWFCGPKGTAFMYRNENSTSKIDLKPAVLSHGINSGFNSEFIWTGLRDYSSYLGLYANMSLWLDCLGGFDHVIDYCTNLNREAGEYLRNTWSTDFLVDPSLCSTMLCVRLPTEFLDNVLKLDEKTSLSYDQAETIQNYFYFKYNIEVPVKCVQNKLYVRISSHIYNNLNDYIKLANAVLEN